MVDGAEDGVEVDGAVEKSPAHVAHQCAQEGVNLHDVAGAGIEDVGEVFVAFEPELADGEGFVAECVGGCRARCGCAQCGCAHENCPYACVWQISAQRSMV